MDSSIPASPSSNSPKKDTGRLKLLTLALGTLAAGSVQSGELNPRISEEPPESPKLRMIIENQRSILDMLTPAHPARSDIEKAMESLQDGGSSTELEHLQTWARAIVNSSYAPPAAKEKAELILQTLTGSGTLEELKNAEEEGWRMSPVTSWERLDTGKHSRDVLSEKKGTVFINGPTNSMLRHDLPRELRGKPVRCIVIVQNVGQIVFDDPKAALVLRPGQKSFPGLNPRFGELSINPSDSIIIDGIIDPSDKPDDQTMVLQLNKRGFIGKNGEPATIKVYFGGKEEKGLVEK